jgi:hypothetical protein
MRRCNEIDVLMVRSHVTVFGGFGVEAAPSPRQGEGALRTVTCNPATPGIRVSQEQFRSRKGAEARTSSGETGESVS